MKHHNPHILQGSLTRGVITLSGPVIFAMFFSSLLNIVDTFWVGKVGATAVAAVSVSWPVMFILIALCVGVSTGTSALVARAIGAKQPEQASRVAKNSLYLGGGLAVVLTVVGLLCTRKIFEFLGTRGELLELAIDYTQIMFLGTMFMVIGFVLSSVMRGEGDTKTPMKIGIIVNIVNMIIDPIFIFTFGLGVTGAALATLIAHIIMMAAYVVFLSQGRHVVKLTFDKLEYSTQIMRDILVIGVPASLRNVANAIGVFFTFKIITSYGAAAVAAYGIAFRVESFGVLPVVAIAVSSLTMVGQNLGASQVKRAKDSGWVSAGLGVVIMTFFGFFVFLFSDTITGIFNNDPEVVRIGSEVLAIKSPAFLFSAIIMTLSSAFQAFGKSQYSFYITVGRVALMLALAYWFNSIWGLVGVWWAVVLSAVVSAVVNMVWYAMYKPAPVEVKS